MKNYWTIQHFDAWEQAKKTRVLTGNPAWAIEGYESAYHWIIDQMVKRLGCKWCYPIWLWAQKPDLRTRWGGEKGSIYLLLQVSLEESMVVISEYHA